MLSVDDLLNLDSFPNLDDVSLSLYKDFSQDILIDRKFQYILEDDAVINLEFTETCIHHLLGIQHIDRSISPDELFAKVEQGLSFSDFEQTDSIKRRFKDMKPRIRMFSCIYQTLRLGEYFYCPNQIVTNTQNVKMDYVVYREVSGKGNNIGIRAVNGELYTPLTLLVARAKNPEEYIDCNNRKRIKSLKIINSNGEYIEQFTYGNGFISKNF